MAIGQVLAAYGTLLAYLVLIGAAGFLASVICRRTQRAAFLVMIGLLSFMLGLPLARLAVLRSGPVLPASVQDAATRMLDRAMQASPFERLREAMQSGFAGGVVGVQVLSNLAAAVVLVLLAWAIFERFNRGDDPEAAGWRSPFVRTTRRFAVPRAWQDALAWKEFNFTVGGRWTVWAKFLLYGLVCLAMPLLAGGSTVELSDIGSAMMIVLGSILLIEIGGLASRIVGQEVRDRTLSSLMVLPHSAGTVVRSKAIGCLPGLLPACAWFAAGAFLAPEEFGTALSYAFGAPLGWYALVRYVVLLHLFGYLSLFTSWHFLPAIAVAVYILDLWLFVLISGLGRWESVAGPALVTLLGLPAIVLLQFAIVARMRAVAAE